MTKIGSLTRNSILIYCHAIYGHLGARAGAETRKHRSADSRAARTEAAARLRNRPPDRRAIGRRDQLSYRVAVSHVVPSRGQALDRGPLGRTRGPAAPPVLPPD